MAYDIGDTVTLTLEVRDASGTLGNATTVAATWTLPDGTTSAASVTNPSAGTYRAAIVATQAGNHGIRWVATGTNAGVLVDGFVVARIVTPGLSVTDARRFLRLSATDVSRDEDLRDAIETATTLCEDFTGRTYRRTVVTDTFDGGRYGISLRSLPVQSVTSVSSSGVPITAYVLDPVAGVLWNGTTAATSTWPSGIQNITVTYVAGSPVPSPRVLEAIRITTAHLWAARRGGSGLPRQSGADADYATGAEPWALPRRAEQLLMPDMAPGI